MTDTQTEIEVELRTTQAMRERLRELSDELGGDDYDRAVVMLLDDFERVKTLLASQSAEIERLKAEIESWKITAGQQVTEAARWYARALAAEANLEEARKAVPLFALDIEAVASRLRSFLSPEAKEKGQ